jgi:hypothetical protein
MVPSVRTVTVGLTAVAGLGLLMAEGCSSSSGGSASNVDCSPYADCGTCMPVDGCGWCGVAPGGSNEAGFCSSSSLGCATYYYSDGCPSPYGGSSGGSSSSGGQAGSSGSGGSSSGGSTGSSGGSPTCEQSGLTYCASCNVCIPPPSCPYWCIEGSQADCSTSPTGLTGCTGPVHDGCDCGASSSSGGSGSGGSGSGSSSGGGQCTSLDSCVTVTSQTSTNGCNGSELLATLTNNCGQSAYCRVCPVVSGSVDEAQCAASGISAGQTQSGEGAGWWWCEGNEVKYLCVPSTEDPSCATF